MPQEDDSATFLEVWVGGGRVGVGGVVAEAVVAGRVWAVRMEVVGTGVGVWQW
jgi:hypothetical protein